MTVVHYRQLRKRIGFDLHRAVQEDLESMAGTLNGPSVLYPHTEGKRAHDVLV